MTASSYSLTEFVEDLRQITAEHSEDSSILREVTPLAQRFAADPTWRDEKHYEADEEEGIGFHLLHEEPDNTLAVFAISWLPGKGVGPHNHRTWSVVVGVDGTELNTFWKRTDDGDKPGFATIEETSRRDIGHGEVIGMDRNAIHSVINNGDQTTLSLHVYGMHLNHSGRSLFDPLANTEEKLIVKVQD
mgnify:FL=1|tara:strand:+ start:256 stop:822 length:567 start_codon:yes stop_codon:yes gene_type:complete